MEWVLGLAALTPMTVFVLVARRRGADLVHDQRTPERRILFAISGKSIPRSAIDVALELAHSERARLVLTYLATVPLRLELEASAKSQLATGLVEMVKRRGRQWGVPVDVRIEVGRTHQHALGELVARERFDRLVVPAATNSTPGLSEREVTWLLGHARGSILVLRPDSEA